MSFTGLKQPITQVMQVSFSFPANTPAGTTVLGSITTDPQLPATTTITVPSNEVWHITDIYLEADADLGVDGYIDFKINDLAQNLRFGPLSLTKKTLFKPVTLRQAIVLDKLSKVNITMQNRTAVGASAVTTKVTIEVVRIPLG